MNILINNNVNIYQFYLKDLPNIPHDLINIGDTLILSNQSNKLENGVYIYKKDRIELFKVSNPQSTYICYVKIAESFTIVDEVETLAYSYSLEPTHVSVYDNIVIYDNVNSIINLTGTKEKTYTDSELLLTTIHAVVLVKNVQYNNIGQASYPEQDPNTKLLIMLPEGERQKMLQQISDNGAKYYVTDHNLRSFHEIVETEANDDNTFFILGQFTGISSTFLDIYIELQTSTFNNIGLTTGTYNVAIDGVHRILNLVEDFDGFLRLDVGVIVSDYDVEANNDVLIYALGQVNDMLIYLPHGYIIDTVNVGGSNIKNLINIPISINGEYEQGKVYIQDEDKPGKYCLVFTSEFFNTTSLDNLKYNIKLIHFE